MASVFEDSADTGAGAQAVRRTQTPARFEVVNPLGIPDWDQHVAKLPGFTLHHSAAWLRVMHEAFGYEPCCVIGLNDGRICAVLPVVEATSLRQPRHGVCLPFADMCPALAENAAAEAALLRHALAYGKERGWKFLEWRGESVFKNYEACQPSLDLAALDQIGVYGPFPTHQYFAEAPAIVFCSHVLDVTAGEDAVWRGIDGSTRGGIRKATRSGVKVEITDSAKAMDGLYWLHCLTSRRHGVLPLPHVYFQMLHRHVIATGQGFILETSYQETPVAACMIFLGGTLGIYAHSSSDYRAQNLRPSNLMLWTAVKTLIERKYGGLHFGRTGLENMGLRSFKRAWGAKEELLYYYAFNFREDHYVHWPLLPAKWRTEVFRRLPFFVAHLLNRRLYRYRR